MIKRSSDCLLDGLCEIIISVQILITLSYTERPYEALLLRVVYTIRRQFLWGGDLLNSNEEYTKINVIKDNVIKILQ